MKQQLTIVALASLALASYWLMTNLERELNPNPEDELTQAIAVARGVKGLYYGADNRLKYEIDSATVSEYSNRGGTKLTEANMRGLDDKQDLAWTGVAQTAKLSADKKVLDLSGGVVLVQLPNSDNPLRASGEHIVYYDDKKEAISDQSIRIENNTSYQTSGQLRLDFAKNRAHFQQGVRVHHQVYQPPTIPPPQFKLPRYPAPFFPYPYRKDAAKEVRLFPQN